MKDKKSVPQHNHQRNMDVLGNIVALVVAISSAGNDDQHVVVAIVLAVAGVWTEDDRAIVVVAIVGANADTFIERIILLILRRMVRKRGC